ncbi:MAG: hypothetical protein Aurels2KO_22650 [Aureliella sp.]
MKRPNRQFPLAFACWLICFAPGLAQIELLTPPSANVATAWKSAQLKAISAQLAGVGKGPLKTELQAQAKWLTAWQPGKLSEETLWPAPKSVTSQKTWIEPVLDPSGLAGPLRKRLLDEEAKPTRRDTDALEKALQENPNDLGLRQLNLHWIDQYKFRKKYCDAIRDSAAAVVTLISRSEIPVGEEGDELRLARAFASYRKVRAIAYRNLPEVTKDRPIQDPKAHDAQLRSAFAETVAVAGRGRKEFILIELRMARVDQRLGTALALLEDYGNTIDRKWLLKKRRDILTELGWTVPAEEAAKLFQRFEDSSGSDH